MDEQPRLTDLIPMRWSIYVLALLAGLALIAGFEGLYVWGLRLAHLTHDGCIAAFDLDSEGSLASYFSATVLLFAGLVAILVYTVRRHRTDDYQGRYRVWLWTAFCCFVMSVDEGSSLHEGFKEMMTVVTGTRILGDGSIWWVIPYGFLIGSVGTRLLVETHRCRLSTACLIGTATCFAVAILGQMDLIMRDQGAREVMVEEGAEMVGDLLLLFGMMLHARYVLLDAKGLLPVRKPKAAKASKPKAASKKTAKAAAVVAASVSNESEEDESESASSSSITVHPPHGLPRPVNPAIVPSNPNKPQPPRVAALVASSGPASTHDETSDAAGKPKMTKAERKAMRKRLEQMRTEREERMRGE